MPKTEAVAILMQKAVLKGDVPGAAVALGDRNGTVFEAGFGDRRIGTAGRMTPDTVVWIASMTKAVVAAGAMRLVEQGVLSLDDPITLYFEGAASSIPPSSPTRRATAQRRSTRTSARRC